MDERVHHTIRHAQVNFTFHDGMDPTLGIQKRESYFSLSFDFLSKGMKSNLKRTISQVTSDEDVLYLFDLIFREFTTLVRSYAFKDYSYLELVWEPGGGRASRKIGLDQLNLFREKKIEISVLLDTSA